MPELEEVDIMEGSSVSDHTGPSLKTYCKLRNALINNGTIVNHVFTRDYEFNTPSAASAVILGRTSNGNADWKTEQGVKLKLKDL